MLGVENTLQDWEERWKRGKPFHISSSGSTGTPKIWELKPDLIRWSANQTLKHFIRTQNRHQLIALPLDKVGGFMQWARAKTWDTPFDILSPRSNPLLHYNGSARLCSLTPMQIEHILSDPKSSEILKQFESILIGGAAIRQDLETTLLHAYPGIHWVHTFGMTETYSHFAGRTLGESVYSVVDDTEIEAHEAGMRIKNPCTEGQWLQTNDWVTITSPTTFLWLGRTDFTINSGGIKIQLEQVEQEIQQLTSWSDQDFFCWWEADPILGQKLILVIKPGMQLPPALPFSSKYFTPKAIYVKDRFKLSPTNKILRAETVLNEES
jgi:o-succinylbenzoate---CoA ligase